MTGDGSTRTEAGLSPDSRCLPTLPHTSEHLLSWNTAPYDSRCGMDAVRVSKRAPGYKNSELSCTLNNILTFFFANRNNSNPSTQMQVTLCIALCALATLTAIAPAAAAPRSMPRVDCMKDDGCDYGRWCDKKHKICRDVPKDALTCDAGHVRYTEHMSGANCVNGYLKPFWGPSLDCMTDDDCDYGNWCNKKHKICRDVPKDARTCDTINHGMTADSESCVNGYWKPQPATHSGYSSCPCPPGGLCFKDRCVAFGNPSTPRAQDAPCRFDNGIHFDCQEGLKCSPTTDTCQPFEGN